MRGSTLLPDLRKHWKAVLSLQRADEGLITLPSRKGPMPAPRGRPLRIKGKPLSRTIIEDREDRA